MTDETTAVYHEAAHAAVACEFGLGDALRRLLVEGQILGKSNEWSWKGNTKIETEELQPENIAEVGFAGAIAEIKVCAAKKIAANSTGDFQQVLSTLAIKNTSLASILDALCAFVEDEKFDQCTKVELSIAGSDTCCKVFLGECEGDMRWIQSTNLPKEKLLGCLEKTSALLDTPKVWNAVSNLAEYILKKLEPEQFVRKELTGPQVAKIICQSADHNGP